jgi:hypothetical protein
MLPRIVLRKGLFVFCGTKWHLVGAPPDDFRICRTPNMNVVVVDFAAEIKCGVMTKNNVLLY